MANQNIAMAVVEASRAGELVPIEIPVVPPGKGQVQIRVRRAGVAFGDILKSANQFIKIKKFPFVPGYDIAGDIEAVGVGVSNLKVGDRVVAAATSGGYTRHTTVNASMVLPLPGSVGYDTGVALNVNYVSAWQMLTRIARVSGGEKILISSAAGGVGTALLQLSSHLGLSTWGIASRSKHDLVRELGAVPIDSRAEDMARALKEAVPDGWDAALEARGPQAARQTIRAVRKGGVFVLFGFVASYNQSNLAIVSGILSLMLFHRGRRFSMYSGNPEKRTEWYREDLGHMLELAAEGKLNPVIDCVIPLEKASEAWTKLTGRAVRGKILLDTE